MLTDPKVKRATTGAEGQAVRLRDGKGLTLVVTARRKQWVYRYTLNGKEGKCSLGDYPVITLSKARELRNQLAGYVADGRNPTHARKEAATARQTFKTVANTWLDHVRRSGDQNEQTNATTRLRLNKHLFPVLGDRLMGDITTRELVGVFTAFDLGAETIKRLANYTKRIFAYATSHQLIPFDPSTVLDKNVVRPPKATSRPAITDDNGVGQLLRDIDNYSGHIQVRLALQLLPHVFLRNMELRQSKWVDVDWEKGQWRIEGSSMKTDKGEVKADHIMPLSSQAIAVLQELYSVTGGSELMFPPMSSNAKLMSENTINKALAALGYKGRHCGHGFRRTFSTQAHELGFRTEWIEKQLHHADPNHTRAAYNAAAYLEQRREMMQKWANYLDALKAL